MTAAPSVRQLVIVLDIDDDVALADLFAHLPEGDERLVYRASDYGAPRLDRINSPNLPIPWQRIEEALARLTDAALAHARPLARRVHWYVTGLAPLPAFALLGRLLPARATAECTFINRRRTGALDVLPLSSEGPAAADVFDTIRGLRDGERLRLSTSGRVPIFISTLGAAPTPALLRSLHESDGSTHDGPVEVRSSAPVIIDGRNALQTAEQLARDLSRLAAVYPGATAAAVFIGGPAQLAFLVGRSLPEGLRDVWFANHRFDTGEYEEALHWRRIAHASSGAHGPASMSEPVALVAVDVDNFRGIARASLRPSAAPHDAGAWVVLLGENGSGKTSLLRGIALALTDRGNAVAVLQDARAWYIRHGETRASCAVRLAEGDAVLKINRVGGREEVALDGLNVVPPWVVAYGCRRSGHGGREQDRAMSPLGDVASLFDDERGLVDIARWILTQEAASPNDPFAKLAYEAVAGALGDVLGHRILPARSDGLWVEPRSGGDAIQFASLSDGFLTTAGWIGDLLVRYVERHRGRPERLTADFPKRMAGVVILDEIDQHLHPRWQVKIIGQVRALFPRMTFVVTTHNPLTIAGARREEVFLMQRNADGDIEVEPARFDPRLRTGTELFAKFFGIGDVFPNELGRKLHRYGALASNPYRDESEQRELDEITELLQREGVDPGFAPEPRAADA